MPNERKLTEKSYRTGEALGLLCTKAFGMGVDVSDIKHVIHYAPTGSLADYVQEIGRAARDPEIQGTAHFDYFPGDLRFVRILNGISEIRQYQIKDMLKKLCALYDRKKHRNLLISSETFEYLFAGSDVDNRTRSGLLLLAKDLKYKYGFPVLIVRPKAMLSKNYVMIPEAIEKEFLYRFGKYTKKVANKTKKVVSGNYGDVTVSSIGNIYLIDMDEIWENYYPEQTFGMFKKLFFEKTYTNRPEDHISPRFRVDIKYLYDYDNIVEKLDQILTKICELFIQHKNSQKKAFTLVEFEKEITSAMGTRIVPHEKFSLFMDQFTITVNEYGPFISSHNQIKILQRRKQSGADENVYFVTSSFPSSIRNTLLRFLTSSKPFRDNVFSDYYPVNQAHSIEIMPLLKILELLGFASYEIRGGEKSETFVRINDPEKIRRLAYGKYHNVILQEIQRKHRASVELLERFFVTSMSDEERWTLIEEYFLGHEEYIHSKLDVNDD